MSISSRQISNAKTGQKVIRLGAIGVDSSHLPEFTKRINALCDAGASPCRVEAFYDPGDHQMPADEVAKWRNQTQGLGVREHPSLDSLLNAVDGVMVLSVSGHSHATLTLPGLSRGMATYVDKPLTCNLNQAKELLTAARQCNARCYSASSLRFAEEVSRINVDQLGDLKVISAFGPGELSSAMEGLFFYGVHTIEMVDAIWGPGVSQVRATTSSDRDLLDLQYADGRFAQLRMERQGCYDFGATVHGSKAVTSFKVDFAEVYDRLVLAMAKFFEGGEEPVKLRDVVENIAVMEAGNRSMCSGGTWQAVEVIR